MWHAPQPDRGMPFDAIEVGGFKSIVDRQRMELRPLTLLAGANSSGKSSVMQAMLLLKQTLEAQFDPGSLYLPGPNVPFESASEVLSRSGDGRLWVGFEFAGTALRSLFRLEEERLMVERTEYRLRDGTPLVLNRGWDTSRFLRENKCFLARGQLEGEGSDRLVLDDDSWNRLVLTGWLGRDGSPHEHGVWRPQNTLPPIDLFPFQDGLRKALHVPGLRNRRVERSFPRAGRGPDFPGRFDEYVAELILAGEGGEALRQLEGWSRRLGMTKTIRAVPVGGSALKILVGRTLDGGADDMVDVGDVGLGVSQVLPVLVSLLVSRHLGRGRLVYLEQPEVHLHPRAQRELAKILVEEVREDGRMVVETHSPLMLLAIQTLTARGELDPKDVVLHWFQRDEEGKTSIESAELDEQGAFGDWPVDFGSVELDAEQAYIDAVEAKLFSHG